MGIAAGGLQGVVHGSNQHLSDLLKVVLLEAPECAEEPVVGLGLLLCLELERGEFERADKVGCLGESVVFGAAVLVHDGVGGQGVLDRIVQGFGDDVLPVVVVDLHLVEALQVFQIVEDQVDHVSLHPRDELCVAFEIALSVGEGVVPDGHMLEHREERLQKALPILDVHPLVVVVAVQERGCVQRDVRQPLLTQCGLVQFDLAVDVGILLVENQREEVAFRFGAALSGFVGEQAYLGHRHLLIKKIAGGQPPAPGSPSSRKDRLYSPIK